jgi:hypothetical protein
MWSMPGSSAARLSLVGSVLAVISVGVAWLPFVSRSTVLSDGVGGPVVFSDTRESLIGEQGWTVVIALLMPVALTLVPVLLRRRPSAQRARVWVAGLLGVGVVLAAASVGMFYIPTLGVLVAAAAVGFAAAKSPPVKSVNG